MIRLMLITEKAHTKETCTIMVNSSGGPVTVEETSVIKSISVYSEDILEPTKIRVWVNNTAVIELPISSGTDKFTERIELPSKKGDHISMSVVRSHQWQACHWQDFDFIEELKKI